MAKVAKMAKPKAKPASTLWRATVGDAALQVTVYERAPGGPLWMRWWDHDAKDMVRTPLGHRNRDVALAVATREQTALAHVRQALTGEPITPGAVRDAATGHAPATVAGIVALFVANRSARKKNRSERRQDERRAALWTAFAGDTEARRLDDVTWNAFVEARMSGAIDAHGRPVPQDKRVKGGAEGVAKDLRFMISCLNYACYVMRPTATGPVPLLERNTWRRGGDAMLPWPKKARAVRRPVGSTRRFELLLAVADQVRSRVPGPSLDGHWYAHPPASYLRVLLLATYHTARRITSVCELRWRDCVWDGPPSARVVVQVTWPVLKREEPEPIDVHPAVGEALAAHRVRCEQMAAWTGRELTPDDPVFPSPSSWHPGRTLAPMKRMTAHGWLQKAEALAGLPALPGGVWHPWRRSWAVRKKHMPTADAIRAGGWRSREAYEECYELADMEGVRRVVLDETRLE